MDLEYNQLKIHDLLNKLEISQESITNCSNAFLNLGKTYGLDMIKTLVNDWNLIFTKFLNLEKMNLKILAMMYLLNDIIQNARNKQNNHCMNYITFFQEILSKHLKELIQQSDTALRKELYKILSIWRDRKVYPVEWLNEFIVFFKSADEKFTESLPENAIAIPSDLILFAQSYQDFVKWREKSEEANGSLKSLENLIVLDNFDEVKTDCELANFKRCLEIQNKYRTAYLKNAAEMLKNVEKNHVKMVFNLKNVCKTLHEIEILEEEIKDY